MTIPEAINVLKTESCYECAGGCDSPYFCGNTNCPLRIATTIAVKCMRHVEHAETEKESDAT